MSLETCNFEINKYPNWLGNLSYVRANAVRWVKL